MSERRRCPICRRWFTPTRSDQRTDRDACRQKAYRLRRRRWSVEADGRVLVDSRYVGTVPAPEAAWEATGVEWQDRPPLPGFRRAGEPRDRVPTRRELRRADAADDVRAVVALGRRIGSISPNDLGDLADEIEDPGERRLWLGRLAIDMTEVAHALLGLAAMTEHVDGPIAFYEGYRHALSRDGQAPTLLASGPPLVFVPPDPAA